MKTLVRKGTNVSLYLFEDATVVDIQENQTVVGNPLEFIISDCNSSNSYLVENVTSPADWNGWKYQYTTDWFLNPTYKEPEAILPFLNFPPLTQG